VTKSKLTISFCVFPGWLDVIFILLLMIVKNYFAHGAGFAIAILALGFVRYFVQVVAVGFLVFGTRNWYIKEIIYLVVALLCFLTYEQKTFVWIISLYFFELTFMNLAMSFFKRSGK
jgi:hypothetical protein